MENDAHARFQRMLLGLPTPPEKHIDANSNVSANAAPPSSTTAAVPPPSPPPAISTSSTPSPGAAPLPITPPAEPATPNMPHLSSLSKLSANRPPTMVAVVEDAWINLCNYFQRVQCADSNEERAALLSELTTVEDGLTTILGALLTERRQLLEAHMPAKPRRPMLEQSLTSTVQGDETQAEGSIAASSLHATQQDSAQATPAPFLALSSGLMMDETLRALPPCYRVLFGDAHRTSLFSPEDSLNTTTAAAPAPFDDVSHIGSLFLLTLCQFAKQDEPPGVRSVILEFLVRLLQEADLPMNRAAYPAGEPVLSLLQLNPPLLIVPLLDMVRKVSKTLDPSNTARRRSSVAVVSSAAALWAAEEAGVDGTFLQDAGRTQLVIFLGSLAEKMERVPALANFFVVEDGTQGERSHFVLLDALLPYLTHDCSAPGWTHRRDTCRYALSAVVSLAKCPDPWIQDLVGAEVRIATNTLIAARTTLLTLCKIPDNDDSATQLLFMRDVLRFWATLSTAAPSVAEALRLVASIEKEFILQTLLPLLQSSDTHVYSAACLIIAHVLQELGGSGSIIARMLANALLATTVRKSSGRVVAGSGYYDAMVHVEAAGLSHGQLEEAAASVLSEQPTTSFLAYYILPHLSSNPYMSAEEKENCIVFGYETTRWSTVKATLLLLQTLVEYVPHLVLREAFLLDMDSLSDVLRKQQQLLANGDERSSSAASMSVSRSPSKTLPNLNVHDCFVRELHEATQASPSLGLQAELVGEQVLARLLRVESNMPVCAMRARQKVMSVVAQLSPASASTASTAADDDSGNCWYHSGVQASPLTVALCEMLMHLDATPYTVSSLVVDLVVSVCLLPDVRVLYTLLDPKRGPLTAALSRLRDLLQHQLANRSGGGTPMSAARPATAASSSMTAPPPLFTLRQLYDALLRNWEALTADERRALSRNSAASQESVTSTPVLTRGNSASGSEGELANPLLREAMEAKSNVLHACLYAEYLHSHLDSVIGYAALSQNLMYLQT